MALKKETNVLHKTLLPKLPYLLFYYKKRVYVVVDMENIKSYVVLWKTRNRIFLKIEILLLNANKIINVENCIQILMFPSK